MAFNTMDIQMHNQSYDLHGPMIPLGSVPFKANLAPPGVPASASVFEVETFLAVENSAKITLEFNGKHLTTFGSYNDYYGFGRAPLTALEEQAKMVSHLEGCNAEVVVTTTLKFKPCYASDKEPFYTGSQKVHYIPMTWRCMREDVKETEETFEVWRAGYATPDAEVYLDRVRELIAQDAAPDRKGDMRHIFAETPDFSAAEFLKIAKGKSDG